MDEGWGWDKRSMDGNNWLEKEWKTLKGFISDPQVQKAAKGFMDEFVSSRILNSVGEDALNNVVKDVSKVNVKA